MNVSNQRNVASGEAAASALGAPAFTLAIEGSTDRIRVTRFDGQERMNDVYAFDVSLTVAAGAAPLGRSAIQQRASLQMQQDKPNEVPGAPMVRHNQDVYVSLPTPHTILYLADIHGVPSDDWQVICHHGAFYALTSSAFVGLAQTEVDTRLHGVFFSGSHRQGRPIPDTYWPLFYWRLRYKVILDNGRLVLQERMRFLQRWKKAANR